MTNFRITTQEAVDSALVELTAIYQKLSGVNIAAMDAKSRQEHNLAVNQLRGFIHHNFGVVAPRRYNVR